MDNKIKAKLEKVKKIIARYNSAIIAFSGGVDSTLLAEIAKEVCKNIKLLTISFSAIPEYEIKDAVRLAKTLELEHETIEVNELAIPEFCDNTPNRCYYCKKYLFSKIKNYALENKFDAVFDGTNTDDTNDYRPGRKALEELGIISPLKDAGLSKKEIRFLSKEMGLTTQSKPAYACLASRFPYGEKLTREKLTRVAKAEEKIRKFGFSQFRVRSHENLARLEFIPEEINRAWQNRKQIEQICKNEGFNYVAIDTVGYRTGAMNEPLPDSIYKK